MLFLVSRIMLHDLIGGTFTQLLQVVDDEDQLFIGGDFAYLQTVIDKVHT